MNEIAANTTDAALEKHVPVYEIKDGIVKVTIGEVDHPMLEEHTLFSGWHLKQRRESRERY